MATPTKRQKIKITSIRVERIVDDMPDTSFLGEYTDEPHEGAIDRVSHEFVGDIDRRAQLISDIQDSIDYDELSPEREAQFERRIERVRRTGETEYGSGSYGREYRFFLPYAGGEKWGNGRNKEYRTYAMQDYNRMEGLSNGHWCFVGIIAKAEIVVGDTVQTIHSGGLWGIESDAGEHQAEIAQNEIANLREQLGALGIGKRAIEYAIRQWDGEITDK